MQHALPVLLASAFLAVSTLSAQAVTGGNLERDIVAIEATLVADPEAALPALQDLVDQLTAAAHSSPEAALAAPAEIARVLSAAAAAASASGLPAHAIADFLTGITSTANRSVDDLGGTVPPVALANAIASVVVSVTDAADRSLSGPQPELATALAKLAARLPRDVLPEMSDALAGLIDGVASGGGVTGRSEGDDGPVSASAN